MEDKFSKIYEKNIWGNGSGPGSSKLYNTKYITFLEDFMNKNNVKSILDIGCGDWQFSQYVNWGEDRLYTGVDCVKNIIETNIKEFGNNKNIFFNHLDPTIDIDLLPNDIDLVILKDILQHWNNESIIKFMDKIVKEKNYKYILIINNYKNSKNEDRDINNKYKYSKLDATQYPLNKYNPQIIGYYRFKQIAIIAPNNYKGIYFF